MKSLSVALALAFAIVLASSTAQAQRPHPHGLGMGDFEANKTFGLGLELGDIVGITGKLFVTGNQAIDFGIGDLYECYYIYGCNNGGLHIYADYLFHPLVLTRADAFELPFYVGAGLRFWDFGYGCDRFGNCTNANAFGIRVPLGLDFDFNNVPLDIFVQLVPTLDFFRDYNGPNTHNVGLDFDFSVGVRYWFS